MVIVMLIVQKLMITFLSNDNGWSASCAPDNGNCNTILNLEGNGNGNWYRKIWEYGIIARVYNG